MEASESFSLRGPDLVSPPFSMGGVRLICYTSTEAQTPRSFVSTPHSPEKKSRRTPYFRPGA